jgi:hypothetical protein
MKAIPASCIALTITAANALAAGSTVEGGGSGLLTECLLALLITIVLFQFVPGITLLVGTVQAIFAPGKDTKQQPPVSH